MKKILLISTYDSFLRTGLAIAKEIDNAEIDIQIRTTASNQLSENQLKSIFGEKEYNISFFFMEGYKKIDFNNYNIIVLSAGNEFIKSFFNFYLHNLNIKREDIITISLFPGVIFGDIDSIASRMNVDILLCNNKIDYQIAKDIKKQYDLDTEILLYGLPIIKKIDIKKRVPRNIYFFEQVKIPETYNDRFYLIRKLVEYASKYPNENIYIKPRVALKEKTVHINRYPMEKLLKKYAKKNPLPKNIFFTYKSIDECFLDMKLGITLSSTVAIEAIYNHIPMAIISDFGLRRDFANQDFLRSGCLVSFNMLGEKELKVNSKWYEEQVYFPENRIELFNELLSSFKKNTNQSCKLIGTASMEYVEIKEKKYLSKNKKRIIKAIKNPLYTFSILWNFLRL